MTSEDRLERFRALAAECPQRPGTGSTASRHMRLFQVGREDLGLARLVEAHWDAVAILEEAGRGPQGGALYGVWASELPGRHLEANRTADGLEVSGTKMFCSGTSIVDRALVTVRAPEPLLIDVNLRANTAALFYDESGWSTDAFRETHTATANFDRVRAKPNEAVGPENWYLNRPGFWQGACGPAACWAGGAAQLIDFALAQSRSDAHTTAHKGALYAASWTLANLLEAAGNDIDHAPDDVDVAHRVALSLRHTVESVSTDVLRRLTRALGPYPLCMVPDITSCMHELDLYLRQSHAERDLEALGRIVDNSSASVRHDK